jgi:hypothetical protein
MLNKLKMKTSELNIYFLLHKRSANSHYKLTFLKIYDGRTKALNKYYQKSEKRTPAHEIRSFQPILYTK